MIDAAPNARHLQLAKQYIKTLQTETGTRWETNVVVPSLGIKKSKKYRIGQYVTKNAAIIAVETFLDKAASWSRKSRQLIAGKNAATVLDLRCQNLALTMQVKTLKHRLAISITKTSPPDVASLYNSLDDKNVTSRTQLREECRKRRKNPQPHPNVSRMSRHNSRTCWI